VGYNCVVCVKQVPDTKQVTGNAMKEDGTVNRAALPAIFNPEDLNALEEALSIRDAYGGTVTALSMGAPAVGNTLRECLYRGVDKAVLITDRKAAASDTLATSYILSCAVKKLQPDIVFCGRQAIDGDTAQVGPQLAEKLGFALVTYLEELIDLQDGVVRIRRNVGNGWEVVSAKLPVLATVTEVANTPRPPAAKKMMKYKKAHPKSEVERMAESLLEGDFDNYTAELKATEVEKYCRKLDDKGLLIEQWSLADIAADPEWCGMSGSPTKVHRIQEVVLAGGEYRQFPPDQQGVQALLDELVADHTLG